MQLPLAPVAYTSATIIGLVLGSFYNVCIHRFLTGESIVFPGSKCPKCGHPLSWWENIPLLSFMLLRGRCRSCKRPISWRYPIVEFVSGVWALALAVKCVNTVPVLWPDMVMVWVVYMVCGGIFIIASFIDFDSFILPDILTLPGAVIALGGAWFFLRPVYGTPTLVESLIGAAAGALVFLVLQQLYKKIKGTDGLGTGDIKLMLMIGALLGWKGLPVAVTAGAVVALVASVFYMLRPGSKAMQTMVPFGPFLSLGAMLYILFGSYYWLWLGA